jgi:hypothetical protein
MGQEAGDNCAGSDYSAWCGCCKAHDGLVGDRELRKIEHARPIISQTLNYSLGLKSRLKGWKIGFA